MSFSTTLNHTSILENLLQEFSPPLDPTLIHAIASDHPNNSQGLSDAKEILSILIQDTHLESSLSSNHFDIELDSSDDTSQLQQLDKALDDWSIEQNQIHQASSQADFLSDDYTITTPSSSADHQSNQGESPPLDHDHSPLSLLRCMFPTLSSDLLIRSLGSDPHSVDLSEAVDILLRIMSSPLQEANLSHPLQSAQALTNPTYGPSPKKHKNQLAKRGLQRFHINDVMRRDERVRVREAEKKATEENHLSVPDNQWAASANQACYLAELLAIEPKRLTSLQLRHNHNLVLALEHLFNELVLERHPLLHSPDEIESFSVQLDSLRAIMPHRDDLLLDRLLTVTQKDGGAAYDLAQFLDDLVEREGTVMWNFFHRLPVDLPNPAPSTTAVSEVTEAEDKDRIPIISPKLGGTSSGRMTETLCINKVNHYRHLRDQAFRKAGQAYQIGRSRPPQRAAAFVYAEEGRKWEVKAKFWELEAGKAKVRERQTSQPRPNSIDLHGLTRNQALVVTQEALNSWWSNASRSGPLLIITGAGKHSHRSLPILFPAISRYLQREGWHFKPVGIGGVNGALLVMGLLTTGTSS